MAEWNIRCVSYVDKGTRVGNAVKKLRLDVLSMPDTKLMKWNNETVCSVSEQVWFCS